jgi:hypothetical protein
MIPKVYAVDFDGYLCTNAWPDIGEPNIAFIQHFRELREQGHKLILWTCREGEMLQRAIDWCADYGLRFDAHNENLPERIERFGGDCRKISADWYCDDKNYWLMPEGDNGKTDSVQHGLHGSHAGDA